MYSTCLFCNSSLGENEAIEHFPVGRRLAFDAAAGRLWVVCKSCARWNLSPLETRWEAIEEAERQFRATKLRVSTDNIGLAQLSEGTELVRIGKPLQSEFAGWRYGDQFRTRSRKMWIGVSGSLALSMGSLAFMGLSVTGRSAGIVGISALSAGIGLNYLSSFSAMYKLWKNNRTIVATVLDDRGTVIPLTQTNATEAALIPTGHTFDWKLRIARDRVTPAAAVARTFGASVRSEYTGKNVYLTGDVGMRALSVILTHANHAGAGKRGVNNALRVLNDAGNVQHLLYQATTSQHKRPDFYATNGSNLLGALPLELRLALEMALHSDDERRAMEGELAELEQRWRDADAIAKISDEMFLSDSINADLESLRREKHSSKTTDKN